MSGISSRIWASWAYRSQGNARVTEAKGEWNSKWLERSICSCSKGLGSEHQGREEFMWDKNSFHPLETQDSWTTEKEFQGIHNHMFFILSGVVSHISPSFPFFCTTWFAGSAFSLQENRLKAMLLRFLNLHFSRQFTFHLHILVFTEDWLCICWWFNKKEICFKSPSKD